MSEPPRLLNLPELTITLRHRRSAVVAVTMRGGRRLQPAALLSGRSVADALALLPQIFTLCASAQREAALAAVAPQRAYDLSAGWQSRQQLRWLEGVRELLWRIWLIWPTRLGAAPEAAPVRQLQQIEQQFQTLISAVTEPWQLPDAATAQVVPSPIDRDQAQRLCDALQQLLQQRLFGIAPARWLQLPDESALRHWAATTDSVAAALLRRLLRKGWAAVGNAPVALLPTLDIAQLQTHFATPHFTAEPQWQGRCYETSTLAHQGMALLSALRERYGNGLLPRLVARLATIADTYGKLLQSVRDQGAGGGCVARPLLTTAALPAGAGDQGTIGAAVAARGLLLHRVALAGQQVSAYQIVAPTEWNFHPQGVAAQALATLQGDVATVTEQATWLIELIDPCIAHQLIID